MKTAITIAALLLTTNVYAFEEGTYNCGSREKRYEATYTVKTINVDGIKLPHLDVTKTYYKNPEDQNSKDRTYNIQGIANRYTDDTGSEVLVMGNMTLELEAGRINCN